MNGRYDETCLGYGYRKSFTGKFILQVKVSIQPCDLQSGSPDGPDYETYRDATRFEVERIICLTTNKELPF